MRATSVARTLHLHRFVFPESSRGISITNDWVKIHKDSLMRHQLLKGTLLFGTALALANHIPAVAQEAPSEQEETAEEARELETVVVRGEYIPAPQRETSQVASFLAPEDLARQGDSNAALALTRLSGLSIVSDKFAYVRGLGDRYSAALLNGSPLPSPEPLRRTVPLDLFPSNALDGATVQKPSR